MAFVQPFITVNRQLEAEQRSQFVSNPPNCSCRKCDYKFRPTKHMMNTVLLGRRRNSFFSSPIWHISGGSRARETTLFLRAESSSVAERFSSLADRLSTDRVRIVESTTPEQKLVDGVAFPVVLSPAPGTSPSLDEVEAWIQEKRPELEKLLGQHLAILFRGFPAAVPAEFNTFISAFGYEEAVMRRQVHGSVRALLEAHPSEYIWMHHEVPFYATPIRRIFFMSEHPAPQGGQTSIAPSTRVYERLSTEQPELVRKALAKGVLKALIVPEAFWQNKFGTTDREQVKAVAAGAGYSLDVMPDGRGWLRRVQSPVFDDPVTGKRSWFNHMSWDWSAYCSPKVPSQGTAFGDGEVMTRDDMERVRDIAEEEKVAIQWRAGDILMVDNQLCMHGRNSYTPPRKNYGAFFH